MKTVCAQYRHVITTTPTTVPVRIMTASCQPGIADVFATVRTQGVDLDDRRGRLPQFELPAQDEANAEAP
jgi:hypothetical protein